MRGKNEQKGRCGAGRHPLTLGSAAASARPKLRNALERSPRTEPRAAAARELLLAALEDLSQGRWKRFRHKLRGRRRPWGRLEGAGAVDLAEHLIHFHGPERALDAARKTLKGAGGRAAAARPQEQRRRSERGVGLARVPALRSLPPGQSHGHRPPSFRFPRKAPELFRPGRASSTNSRAPGLRSCGRPRPRLAPLPAPHSRRGLTAVLPSRARPRLLGAALRVLGQEKENFQEFLAALSYLLEDEGAPQTPAGGVGALLRGAPELRGRLALTTRFLFGLLNAERMRDMEHHFGCAVSERGKQDVPRWVQDQGQGCPRAAPEGTERTQALRGAGESEEEEGEELKDLLELLHCLYETQEDALVHQALRGLPELALERVHFSRTDLAVLSYCVRRCPAGQALQLVSRRLTTAQEKKKKSLMKRLQGRLGGSSSRTTMRKPPGSPLHPLCEWTDGQCGLNTLTRSRCKLPDLVCRDLSEALTELGLFHSWLSEAGLHALSEGLAWPQVLQTLRVQRLGLQELPVRVCPTLTTLDLSGCQLSGPMVTYLCAVLQLPGCRLQSLSLTSVELSEQSLPELRAVGTAKAGLANHPALDGDPQPHKGLGSAPEALGEGSSQPRGEEGLPSPNPTAAPPTFLSWEPPALPLQAPLSSKGDDGRPQELRAFTWCRMTHLLILCPRTVWAPIAHYSAPAVGDQAGAAPWLKIHPWIRLKAELELGSPRPRRHDWSRRPGPPVPPAPGVGTSHPARPARPGAGTAGPSGDKAAAGYFSLRSGAHPLEPRDAAGLRRAPGTRPTARLPPNPQLLPAPHPPVPSRPPGG
ncbi:LOW QUALITY PROTEIN: NACHT, LRR and PYD domains-containing protein 6 [Megaptera novaeangliae]